MWGIGRQHRSRVVACCKPRCLSFASADILAVSSVAQRLGGAAPWDASAALTSATCCRDSWGSWASQKSGCGSDLECGCHSRLTVRDARAIGSIEYTRFKYCDIQPRCDIFNHSQMWIPALMGQADDEQRAKWLPPSQRLALIGTYAQTELGHGTFVRGLETTATYDPASQQFVVHSPTLSSTKWWPGGES